MNSSSLSHRDEACKTYLEQTKLLITLASAFIIAPAVLFEKINIVSSLSIWSELLFVGSVLFGYLVFGSIAGSQHKGECNVYKPSTMWLSRFEILTFLLGLVLFILNLKGFETKPQATSSPVVDNAARFNNIYFDFDQWQLRPESYRELDLLVDSLANNSAMSVEISAHTDNIGSDSANIVLSNKRAASVVQYFTARGIPHRQLSVKGYGESIPLTTNNTYEGRQMNRRVEFRVLD